MLDLLVNKRIGGVIVVSVICLLTLMIGVDLIKMPSEQASATALNYTATASVINPRYKQIIFETSAGKKFRIFCTHIQTICTNARQRRDSIYEIAVFPVSLDGDYWLVSAESEGVDLISSSAQAESYIKFRRRAKLRFMFSVLASALSLWFLLHLNTRK